MMKIITLATMAILGTCSSLAAFPNIQNYQHIVTILNQPDQPKAFTHQNPIKMRKEIVDVNSVYSGFDKDLNLRVTVRIPDGKSLSEAKCILDDGSNFEYSDYCDGDEDEDGKAYFFVFEDNGRFMFMEKYLFGVFQSWE